MGFEIRIGTDVPTGFQIRIGSTPTPVTPGRGPAGVATLVLDIADQATTVYEWSTNIIQSYSGKEQRISIVGCPRETYMFSSTLSDGELAELQSLIAYDGSQGEVFQVGLTYEALVIANTLSGTTVSVLDTSKSDWCYPGSRVVIVDRETREKFNAVVQSSTANTIELDVATGAFGEAGNLIMPAVPCYLESQQQLSQHAVNAGRGELRARAIIFGDENDEWNPVGATVTTYTDPDDARVYSVWDRRIVVDDQSDRGISFGTEIVDRGGQLANVAKWTYAKFPRSLRLVVPDDATRQWFKAFIGAVAGRRRAWLLPTWKPDLKIASGDASTGTIVVFGPPTVEAADYAGKYKDKSLAHRWLQILKADGTVAYRKIADAADNGDGTQDVLLDSPVAGAVEMVSFLELVRFGEDEFPLRWQEMTGYGEFPVLVVQQ